MAASFAPSNRLSSTTSPQLLRYPTLSRRLLAPSSLPNALRHRRGAPVVAAEAKPTVLLAEKLGEAALELLRDFTDVDCSYNLSPEELRAKVARCDAPHRAQWHQGRPRRLRVLWRPAQHNVGTAIQHNIGNPIVVHYIHLWMSNQLGRQNWGILVLFEVLDLWLAKVVLFKGIQSIPKHCPHQHERFWMSMLYSLFATWNYHSIWTRLLYCN